MEEVDLTEKQIQKVHPQGLGLLELQLYIALLVIDTSLELKPLVFVMRDSDARAPGTLQIGSMWCGPHVYIMTPTI